MKLSIKSFLAGVIVASVCVTAVYGFAVIKSVEYNSNKVVYNGREITMVGTPMISLVKQGQTDISNYMPLRAVLEAMGYEVKWDGQTQTVHINTRFVTQGGPSAQVEEPEEPEQKPEENAVPSPIEGYWINTAEGVTIKYHFGNDGHFEALSNINGVSTYTMKGVYTLEDGVLTLIYDEANDDPRVFDVELAADGSGFIANVDGDIVIFDADAADTDWAEH